MKNITIKIVQINFNKDIKNELNKFAKTYKMKVKYCYGYISKFDKLNEFKINLQKIVQTVLI